MSCATVTAGCIAMIIEISSSGGFGGITAAGLNKRIDVEKQPTPVQQEICEYFELKDLRLLASRSNGKHGADMMTYRITVTDREDGEHVYTIREDQLPPEMLDLIDAM